MLRFPGKQARSALEKAAGAAFLRVLTVGLYTRSLRYSSRAPAHRRRLAGRGAACVRLTDRFRLPDQGSGQEALL
jgi:hypothetical protein